MVWQLFFVHWPAYAFISDDDEILVVWSRCQMNVGLVVLRFWEQLFGSNSTHSTRLGSTWQATTTDKLANCKTAKTKLPLRCCHGIGSRPSWLLASNASSPAAPSVKMIAISSRLSVPRLPSCICRRSKVTLSVEPPPILLDGYVERPGVLALMESTLYRDSWSQSSRPFVSTFPNRGIHFLSIDVFSGLSSSSTVSESFSQMHSELANDLSTHADVVLVARGPLPCLVAQFYLESLPLSGLILIDPLIVPRRDGTGDDDERSLQSSAQTFMEIASKADCFDLHNETSCKNGEEANLLDKMQRNSEFDRPLKLEAGVIPVKVLYTGGAIGHETKEFRRCAEQTASCHTPEDGTGLWGDVAAEQLETDNDTALETIYSFHDEII